MMSVLITMMSGTAMAEPLTKNQGDAILKELREIKLPVPVLRAVRDNRFSRDQKVLYRRRQGAPHPA